MSTEGAREHAVIGILAHVDAGKTTLSEGMLYLGGTIRKMGRVDRRDTYLDTDETERARGITIYSKTARFPAVSLPGREYILLDTPGHADFGAETERTLAVLDAAVLMIAAPDGVTAQVRLLFDLLRHYGVPVIFFVNKMDQAEAAGDAETRRMEVLAEIREKLTENAVDFTNGAEDEEVQESAALAGGDEKMLDLLMEGGTIPDEAIAVMIRERTLFPVLFGSALRMQGVEELLHFMDRFVALPEYPSEFSARVYKITRDDAGERLTWMKITGGEIAVRQAVTYPVRSEDPEDAGEIAEKISQIRLYNGEKYEPVRTASAGEICCVCGLSKTFAGMGLGEESGEAQGILAPPLTWEILLTQNVDPFRAHQLLQPIAEEEPMLDLTYDGRKRVIRARLMGQVQREIIRDLVKKRTGLEIGFGRPEIIYKETIASPVLGVGHFEPLRHYAEVHLAMYPGEEGSGITIESRTPTDVLSRQYQNQVLNALAHRRHRGVLTGSELTDVRIVLIGGRSHEKHTEGGDFRQAALRAVRQGLMTAETVLLEPYYDFELTLPQEGIGRVLTDLTAMHAAFSSPEIKGNTALITGSAPVAAMDAYQETLTAFTKGEGHLTLRTGAYKPCGNAEEAVLKAGYDPEADTGQPSASVFCSHGAGMIVPWYEVYDYMHVDTGFRPESRAEDGKDAGTPELTGQEMFRSSVSRAGAAGRWDAYGRHIEKTDAESFREREAGRFAAEEELKAIFERTYGPVKRRVEKERPAVREYGPEKTKPGKPRPKPEKEYLLVDGYNIIFAWENLRALASSDIKAARDMLLDILANYAGYVKSSVICVFDAYKVAEGQERIYRHHTIDVVFTRQAETADQYIEKAAHELQKKYAVTVATSDAVEQVIIFSAGARRLSAMDLLAEIVTAEERVREKITDEVQVRGGRLETSLADKVADAMKNIGEQ